MDSDQVNALTFYFIIWIWFWMQT